MSEVVEATSKDEAIATTEAVTEATETVEAQEATAEAEVSTADESIETPTELSFLDSLDEELRGQKALQDFKDLNGLAKSYLHLNSMIGKKVTDLSPEELGQVYNKLGRPEKAEEYKLPDGVHEEALGWYTKTAHELGLTQEQARSMAESYMELEKVRTEEHEKAINAQQEEWMAEIKKDFGSAFDKRVETAKKAIEAFGGAELREAMNQTGLGNHPAMVKAFSQIGKEMLESSLPQADAEASFGVTPSDAQNKINNLKRDPEFMKAYMSPTHPGHKAAVDELQGYHKIIHGNA